MSKNGFVKQGIVGLLLSVAVQMLMLLLIGWGGAAGWIDGEKLLAPVLVSVVLSVAVGTLYLVGKMKWSVLGAALLLGVGMQLLTALAGYLAYGDLSWDGSRWLMPVIGFLTALVVGVYVSRPKAKNKNRKKMRHQRKRA